MFRIRKVQDDVFPMNRNALLQVQEILRSQFAALGESQVQSLPEQLRDPLKYGFRSILLVAENISGRVQGFAMLMHAPDRKFCFLDFIATHRDFSKSGIGSALYDRCREEAMLLKVSGIFMESLPDDECLCPDPDTLKQNVARLRFWERFGARPVINTLYETSVKEGETCPPYLLFDPLDEGSPLSMAMARSAVDAILRRKYAGYCPDEYVRKVVSSFTDDPVRIREPRYSRSAGTANHLKARSGKKPVLLVYNDSHAIHHVRERGYVESPVRIKAVLRSLGKSSIFSVMPAATFSEKHIRAVHSNAMVDYLKKVSSSLPEGKSVYPYVFPIRNSNRRPTDQTLLAGYYCIDTFTPIHRNAWMAARLASDCALTCAEQLLLGVPYAYALVRPPGHHAERKAYGGFCYLNSAAIAAHFLSRYGRVALLDIDFHHGNGHQDIFYQRKDVLTVSLHGHPSYTYPYFCGFRKEKGEGEGLGYNHNFPLPADTTPETYRKVLREALSIIKKFKPAFLVLSFGLDNAKGDPTGSFSFLSSDFEKTGHMIGSMNLPVLAVQEGGYLTRTMGHNALAFFKGIYESA